MNRRQVTALLSGTAAASALAPMPVIAQDYPSRVVKLIVPYAAGGPTDVIARIAAKGLGEALGQSFIVENRGGGNSVIGTQAAARAPADGYTLLLAANTHVVIPSLYARPTYEPVKDFEPVGMLAFADFVFVINKALPVTDLAGLIAYGKANPGKLTYGSPAYGSPNDLALEYLKQKTGVDILRVGYTGGGPALNGVMAGDVNMTLSSMPVGLQHVESGALKVVAVLGTKRYHALPDTPFASKIVPGMEAQGWFSIVAPAGTSAPIVAKLNSALNEFVASEDFKTRLLAFGAEPARLSMAEFRALMESDRVKWAEVAAAANIKIRD